MVFDIDEPGLEQNPHFRMSDFQTAERFPVTNADLGIGQHNAGLLQSSTLQGLDLTLFYQDASPITYSLSSDGWITDADYRKIIKLPVEFRDGLSAAWNNKLVFVGDGGKIAIIHV